ncbi:MAG: hypothetical protein IJF87_08620 [Erysipelotrichaceae bacterium]|nr:hypothetical protein [Erysipelotrichaceae bacterium]
MTKQELKTIADNFGCICDYSPSDDFMAEHCGEWCEEHCGKVEDWECWGKWLEEIEK